MNHKHFILPVLALICAVSSCSSRLGRTEAETAIIGHYGFPSVEIERITGAETPGNHLNPRRPYSLFGGIQIGQSSPLFYFAPPTTMFGVSSYGLTDAGYAYLAPTEACNACNEPLPNRLLGNTMFYCVACAIWEFKETGGIVQDADGTSATVHYTVVARLVNTFGEYNGITEGMEVGRTSTFRRYDDGSWRIEDPKPAHIVKPADIPYYAAHYTGQRDPNPVR